MERLRLAKQDKKPKNKQKQNLLKKSLIGQVLQIGEGVKSSKSLKNEQNPKKIKIEEETSESDTSITFVYTSITLTSIKITSITLL